ncbi:MAG: PKD domain-containing protein [Planctomycetota bacterium]|nr:PKD domain-containing protein [Planctomycetota bacterium]
MPPRFPHRGQTGAVIWATNRDAGLRAAQGDRAGNALDEEFPSDAGILLVRIPGANLNDTLAVTGALTLGGTARLNVDLLGYGVGQSASNLIGAESGSIASSGRFPNFNPATDVFNNAGGKVVTDDYRYGSPSQVIICVETPPAVTASASPASGAVQLAVAFTASGSDADGDTLTYSWDFGDGSSVSTEQNPTHTYVAAGTYTATVTASDGKGGTATASVTVSVHTPPTVTASASPASGAVQLAVAFTASGSDVNGNTLTYSWDFGDGSPVSTEQDPTHTYVAVGTYTATVTVSDGKGGTATASVTVTVVAAGGFMLGDTDSDGDGYYDEIETALGSSPADYSSRPLGLATVTTNGNLYTVKTNIRLNFAKPQGNDSITMTGVLFIPAGFSIAGQTVIVDVGGVVKAFTLDAKGASPNGNERFTTKVRARRGVVPLQEAKFTLTMKKGTYAATLLDDGLVNEDVLKCVSVPETVIFNGEVLMKAAALTYRGHTGQTGLAR